MAPVTEALPARALAGTDTSGTIGTAVAVTNVFVLRVRGYDLSEGKHMKRVVA
jgi:hypothetical protein